MAEHTTCPGCQQALPVPASRHVRWLTCPHCLSRVVNPEVLTAEGILAEPPARPAPRPEGIQAEPASGADADPGLLYIATKEGCLFNLSCSGQLVLALAFLGAIVAGCHGQFGGAAGAAGGLLVVVLMSAAIVSSWGGGQGAPRPGALWHPGPVGLPGDPTGHRVPGLRVPGLCESIQGIGWPPVPTLVITRVVRGDRGSSGRLPGGRLPHRGGDSALGSDATEKNRQVAGRSVTGRTSRARKVPPRSL
jgi:hypothetical protein